MRDDARIVAFRSTPDILRDINRYFTPPVFSQENSGVFGGVTISWVCITAVSSLAAPWLRPIMWYFAGVSALGVLTLAGWIILMRRRSQQDHFVKDPRRMGEVFVRIDHYGITMATDISSDFLSWFGIRKVEVFGQGVFFRSGPSHGIYVPRLAFDSDTDFQDFCAQMHRYREEKRKPPFLADGGTSTDDGPARLN